MIALVRTYSLSQAREVLSREMPLGSALKPYDPHAVRWVGFDGGARCWERSPLRSIFRREALVLECMDHDPEGRHASDPAALSDGKPPSPEIARAIVQQLRAWHAEPTHYALAVHCTAGLYRSGTVAQYAIDVLGAREPEESNRSNIRLLDGSREITFNATLLRMMKAVAE